MSVIFSAVFGIRMSSLENPIIAEFTSLWGIEAKCLTLPCSYDEGEQILTKSTDFEPGTLLIDFLPILQRLPLALQPWHRKLSAVTGRESELYLALLSRLRESLRNGRAPDCFGKLLLEVCTLK